MAEQGDQIGHGYAAVDSIQNFAFEGIEVMFDR